MKSHEETIKEIMKIEDREQRNEALNAYYKTAKYNNHAVGEMFKSWLVGGFLLIVIGGAILYFVAKIAAFLIKV